MEGRKSGLPAFGLVLLLLFAMNVGLAFLPAPPQFVGIIGLVVTILFISLPVLGLFRAADHPWSPKLAGITVLVGVALQIALTVLVRQGIVGGVVAAVCQALSQTALVVWCAGLGALLATSLKEKNLLVPVSAFLAAFDIFLVLNPVGFTNQMLKADPEILSKVALTVPKVQTTPTFGPVSPAAFVGPADLLFSAMFFVAIFRFNMRAKQTLMALIPALVIYMGIVLFTGWPLPAMVPIGLVVLAVNWKEFNLTREEWISTGVVVGFIALLFGAGMALAPRPAPSTPESDRGPIESVPTPEPDDPNQSPSESPTAPGSTPDRP